MLRPTLASALALPVLLALAASAIAADTTVSVPVGEWVAAVAEVATVILVAAAVWALRMLPQPVYRLLMMVRAEQLIERAIGYGIQSVAGAARGRILTVDVGNRVLAAAARYAVESAGDVVAWIGGEAEVRRKILARLDLVPEASVDEAGRLSGRPVTPGE